MQYESREALRKYFLHVVQNGNSQSTTFFEINLIDFFCECQKECTLFSKNPSKYLIQLQEYLFASLERGDYAKLLKIHNTIVLMRCIPYVSNIYKKFNQINSDHLGHWVVLTGTVIQSTQKKTLEKSKIFVCDQCADSNRHQNNYQNYYMFEVVSTPCTNLIPKQKSNSLFTKFSQNLKKRKDKVQQQNQNKSDIQMGQCKCRRFTPLETQKICVDYQQLRIQEQFKHISAGKLPQTLTVVIEGNFPNTFRPGDNISVSGILDYRFKKPVKEIKLQAQLILFANNITLLKLNSTKDNFDKESMTEESQYAEFPLNFYQEYNLNSKENLIVKQLEFRNEVVKKFCPSIFGRQIVKLGLTLSLLGGVSYQNQNTKIRGQSHILLVGEPGTGKSVLIKEAANLAERSFFTNGIGTSSAGLSVSYYKEGGDWTIQAGALVLADNGVCCIDEITLLAKKQENTLLEAMEQQTISSAKASIVGKLNARTTLICACNPITPSQKYDPDVGLEVNTGLSIPLLTRFDLVLILKDQNDKYQDAQKCDYILSKFCDEQPQNEVCQRQNFSLKALLRKCKVYEPELRCGQILSKYYTQERKNAQKVTTARAFQSLCRLTEAHAKLMMRDSTNQLDCMSAIMITENKYVSTIEEYYAYLDYFNNKYGTDLD